MFRLCKFICCFGGLSTDLGAASKVLDRSKGLGYSIKVKLNQYGILSAVSIHLSKTLIASF